MSTASVVPSIPTAVDSIQRRFNKFHFSNPHVYRALVALARKAKASGIKTYGIAGLYEKLRWDMNVETVGVTEQFKLSDNFKSRYARLIMSQERDLAGFFTTKKLAYES
jgi:hypothetical protein